MGNRQKKNWNIFRNVLLARYTGELPLVGVLSERPHASGLSVRYSVRASGISRAVEATRENAMRVRLRFEAAMSLNFFLASSHLCGPSSRRNAVNETVRPAPSEETETRGGNVIHSPCARARSHVTALPVRSAIDCTG